MFEAATLYFVFNQKAQRRVPVLRNVFMIDMVADMDVSARNGDASARGEKGWWSDPDAWVSGVRVGPPAGESGIPVKIVLSSGCPGCCSMRGGRAGRYRRRADPFRVRFPWCGPGGGVGLWRGCWRSFEK